MYVKIESGAVAQYPYSPGQLIADNPDTSFPATMGDERLADWGVYPVAATAMPDADWLTETVEEGNPVLAGSAWRQSWSVRPATAAEIAERTESVKANVIEATQARLDDFARTRNYDGILSACTYATSTVPKFQGEGQYCVEARDATWMALYEILGEVEAGTRPMPSGYADVEPELPDLVWPA